VQQRFAMLINFIDEVSIAGLLVRGLAGAVGLLGFGAERCMSATSMPTRTGSCWAWWPVGVRDWLGYLLMSQ
jgi:hypothetical protein